MTHPEASRQVSRQVALPLNSRLQRTQLALPHLAQVGLPPQIPNLRSPPCPSVLHSHHHALLVPMLVERETPS